LAAARGDTLLSLARDMPLDDPANPRASLEVRWKHTDAVAISSDVLQFEPQEFGIDPLDAVRWATRHGAELMGQAGELGIVAPGALADLVVVDGDPSANIRVLRDANNVKAVLIGGEFVKGNLAILSGRGGGMNEVTRRSAAGVARLGIPAARRLSRSRVQERGRVEFPIGEHVPLRFGIHREWGRK
jgi:hypothetical protein